MSLTQHPSGRYAYLPAGQAYSAGVVAQPGYEIVWATFAQPPPLAAGIQRAAAIASEQSGTAAALCAFALRNVRPLNMPDFAGFNEHYRSLLADYEIQSLGGDNPLARTNVVARGFPVDEPVVYAFGYVRTAAQNQQPTFVVSGAAELARDADGRVGEVVAPGDTSPEAMKAKVSTVLAEMQRRLDRLGVGWPQVTASDLYTVDDPWPALDELLHRLGPAAVHGLRWMPSRPPIVGLDVEMDLRGVGAEQVVAAVESVDG